MSAETIHTFIEYHIDMTCPSGTPLIKSRTNNLLQMILFARFHPQPDGAHHENGPALADGVEKSSRSEWRFQIRELSHS